MTKPTKRAITDPLKRQPNLKMTPAVLQLLYDEMSKYPSVRKACAVAGINRCTYYHHMEHTEGFAEWMEEARQNAYDNLEEVAKLRAVDGTDKPVTFQGKITATYKEYSDTLMLALLKAGRPHKFKDRVANEHEYPNGIPIKITQVKRVIVRAPMKKVTKSAEPGRDA